MHLLGASLPGQFDDKLFVSSLIKYIFPLLVVLEFVMHPRYMQLKFSMAPKMGGCKIPIVHGPCFTLGVDMHGWAVSNVFFMFTPT